MYVDPSIPVKVDVALEGVVILPLEPDIILHAPVPIDGLFPAKVTLVNPQVDNPVWSAPALAVGF